MPSQLYFVRLLTVILSQEFAITIYNIFQTNVSQALPIIQEHVVTAIK